METRRINKTIGRVVCSIVWCLSLLAHNSTDLWFLLAGPLFRKAAENQMKRQQNELAQSILEARFAKTISCLTQPHSLGPRQRSLANGGSCRTISHYDFITPSIIPVCEMCLCTLKCDEEVL